MRPLPVFRVAVASLALLAARSARLDAQEQPALTPLDAPPRASSMVLRMELIPHALGGVPVESLPPFERPNGALLRPGSFVYQLSSRRDTLVTPLGQRAVTVSEANVAGLPYWLIVEARTGTPVVTSDSLYLARADLTPGRWIASHGRSQLATTFSRDSMFVAIQSYQGRASFAAPLPRGALLTAGMVERLVEMLPLGTGFRTGATLLLFELGEPRVIPAELVVDGEEPVVLLDRTVDCWVVLLRGGTLEERLWVTKEGARVVKTEQVTGGGLLTALLQP